MKDRERILELVKKGILSSEEALVLLESMAQEKDEQQIQQAAQDISKEKETPFVKEVTEEEKIQAKEEAAKKEAEKAEKKAALEKELATLAEKANVASAHLDEKNEQLKELSTRIKEKQEAKQVLDTMEELGTMTESKEIERTQVIKELKELQDEKAILEEGKKVLEDELKIINQKRFQSTKEKVAQKLDIPEDWKDQAQDTLNHVGGKVYDASNQLGSFLKKTFTGLSEAINENVDWKDVNIKVPGVASTKFEHTFKYPEVNASLIDIKLANGKVTFKQSDTEDLIVDAKIKLYGKLESATPLEAFLEKSQIDVDDELISFQIPNKKVQADLIFYLPKKTYDHVALNLLNGEIQSDSLEAKDIYIKSTNGSVNFSNVTATMLEIHEVNGTVNLNGTELRDLFVESVNGDIILKDFKAKSVKTSVVNGTVKATVKNLDLKRFEASSGNGDIKISVPKELSLNGTVKTNFGAIHERLSQMDSLVEKEDGAKTGIMKHLEFERMTDSPEIASIFATTTRGSIYLKDGNE